jgi:thiosulfate/3-mercaptopyruvate sulfurtransferase
MSMIGRKMSSAAWPLLVSPAWLHSRLADPLVVVLDCSWYMPAMKRNGAAEFAQSSIQGARFLDIDGTSDAASALPHMLPSPEAFERVVAQLGIDASQHVVCYDGAGVFSAPRAWWQFRAFGFESVSVLDGGLPAWKLGGFETVPGAPAPPVRIGAERWTASLKTPQLVRGLPDMRAVVASNCATSQVADARASGRFEGSAPEPRPDCVSGHMPGARNLPFTELLQPLDPGGQPGTRFKDVDALASAFDAAGIRLDQPLIGTCGSGMTACIIAHAAAQLGKMDTEIYDGSWSEWGSRKDLPIVRKD